MSHPVSNTGLPMFLPSLFPEGMLIYVAGASDDPTAGRGAGAPFTVSSTALTPTTQTISITMLDWVYVAGGGLTWQGAVTGDWASLQVVAPPTKICPNKAGQGGADLTPAGTVVPNLQGAGAYDVTYAVPIRNVDNDGRSMGQWDWSQPDTGLGVVTPAQPDGSGNPVGDYILVPATLPLAQFIARFQLNGLGTWNLNQPFVKPAQVLPHWQMQVLVHNSGHAGLSLSWQLIMARAQTI